MQATPSSHSRSQFRPSTQHPTPLQVSAALCTMHLATLQSWQGQEAAPEPAAQWSPMSTHFSSPPCDLHAAQAHWGHSVQRMVIRKHRGVLPTLQSPGWASTDPHSPVGGRPASSFVVCFQGRTQHTHKTGNSVAPAKTQPQPHTAVRWPFHGWAQGIQLPPLSSSPGVPHAYLTSLSGSGHARTHAHTQTNIPHTHTYTHHSHHTHIHTSHISYTHHKHTHISSHTYHTYIHITHTYHKYTSHMHHTHVTHTSHTSQTYHTSHTHHKHTHVSHITNITHTIRDTHITQTHPSHISHIHDTCITQAHTNTHITYHT